MKFARSTLGLGAAIVATATSFALAETPATPSGADGDVLVPERVISERMGAYKIIAENRPAPRRRAISRSSPNIDQGY